jgi:hypothetical protein
MFKLTRDETSAADALEDRHQWPVRFTALYSEDDTPAKIFVMQQSPDADLFADSLSCIASAVQMHDLPEDEPSAGSPFYRVNVVTKLCRSAKAAEEFIEKVKDAVQDLADNLASAELLSEAEEVTIEPTT